jgi:hypothetical protein
LQSEVSGSNRGPAAYSVMAIPENRQVKGALESA